MRDPFFENSRNPPAIQIGGLDGWRIQYPMYKASGALDDDANQLNTLECMEEKKHTKKVSNFKGAIDDQREGRCAPCNRITNSHAASQLNQKL